MRKAFFGLGWVFLVAAFVGAAAEAMARFAVGGGGVVMSTAETWAALWPTSLILTRDFLAGTGLGWLWNPVLRGLMIFPAWILFGLPGAALAWFCRPGRGRERPLEPEEEDALFLFDSLAQRAAEEEAEGFGFDDTLTGTPAPRNDRP